MTNFPFVVGPKHTPIIEKLGSEDAGYIEIPRRGFLSVGERAAMQQAIAVDNSSQRLLSLVRSCANHYSIDMEEAYKSVVSAMSTRVDGGKHVEDISVTFADELDSVTSAMSSAQAHQQLVKAYVLLAFRVSDEIEFEQVADLHPDLLQALVDLYDDEDNKSVSRLASAISDKPAKEGEKIEEETAENVELAEKKPARKAKQA